MIVPSIHSAFVRKLLARVFTYSIFPAITCIVIIDWGQWQRWSEIEWWNFAAFITFKSKESRFDILISILTSTNNNIAYE